MDIFVFKQSVFAEDVGGDVSWGEKTGEEEQEERRSVMGAGLVWKIGFW